MEYILLLIAFALTSSANVIPIPSKAETKLLANSIQEDGKKIPEIPEVSDVEFIKDAATVTNGKHSEPEEIMHTAENIVFRPLFSYRQVKEKRRRLHNQQNPSRKTNNISANRRSQKTSAPVRYVYAYPYQSGYRTQDNPTYYYNSGYYQ